MTITFALENQSSAHAISYAAKELLLRVGVRFEVCSYDGLADRDVGSLITYGRALPSVRLRTTSGWIHICESSIWGTVRTRGDLAVASPQVYQDGVPVLFEHREPLGVDDCTLQPDYVYTGDVIASTFLMLTRYEEVVASDRDAHDRFPASAGYGLQSGTLTRPVVDEYAQLIRQRLVPHVTPDALEPPWGSHAICVTHDIDRVRIFDSLRHLGGVAKGCLRKNPRRAGRVALDFLGTVTGRARDPLDNLESLSLRELRHGVRSTFLFLAGGDTKYDGRYTLDAVREPIKRLRDAGHEVGLHGSYGTYLSKEALLAEREALERAIGSPVHSVRQHYLRFRVPDTWRAMESSGLRADSSVGFAEHEGFRAGTSFPFQAYDVTMDRTLDVWEVPLIAMDATLYGYRGLSSQQSQHVLEGLLETTRATNGILTVLWHNNAFYEPLYPGGSALFDWLLTSATEGGARACTISEATSLWKKREEDLACGS